MGQKSLDRWEGICGKPTLKMDGIGMEEDRGRKGGDRGRKVQVCPT